MAYDELRTDPHLGEKYMLSYIERSSDIFGDTENVAKVEYCGLQSY